MTEAWFLSYVEQALVPTLTPGEVVILDNLPAHKEAAVRDAVEADGAKLLVLPPYSPELNSIENAYASPPLKSPSSRSCSERPPPDP